LQFVRDPEFEFVPEINLGKTFLVLSGLERHPIFHFHASRSRRGRLIQKGKVTRTAQTDTRPKNKRQDDERPECLHKR
jgi:hypothetical protein